MKVSIDRIRVGDIIITKDYWMYIVNKKSDGKLFCYPVNEDGAKGERIDIQSVADVWRRVD